MDDEANNYSDHIHAQLPGHHLQVLDGDDLTTDETGNTKGRVPDETDLALTTEKKGFHTNSASCSYTILKCCNDLRNNLALTVISDLK